MLRCGSGIETYTLAADDLMRLAGQGALGLLPLVPFSKGGETPEAAERAARLALMQAPAEQAEPLAVLVGVFAARQLGADMVAQYSTAIPPTNNRAENTRLAQSGGLVYTRWVCLRARAYLPGPHEWGARGWRGLTAAFDVVSQTHAAGAML